MDYCWQLDAARRILKQLEAQGCNPAALPSPEEFVRALRATGYLIALET